MAATKFVHIKVGASRTGHDHHLDLVNDAGVYALRVHDEIIEYLFDRDQGWDRRQAAAWVATHALVP